ncbi:hypothetical protein E6H34_10475 [Candidatus Bathyarchaeota archaeon]|nr:MAG: hypothetical protein E6H34_10475 [Candidatus Bathyarchaeota archaeon]
MPPRRIREFTNQPGNAQWKHARTIHPVSMFLFLQAFFIVISLFWLLYMFQNYIIFGSQLYETLTAENNRARMIGPGLRLPILKKKLAFHQDPFLV